MAAIEAAYLLSMERSTVAVLITGGAGFIGSNLVRRLIGLEEGVTVLDDLSTGRAPNLEGLEDSVEFLEGSICDPALVRRACRRVEVIYHLAALPSVARSVEDPVRTNDVNVGGTLQVLLAARDAGVRKVVFASSSSIYGNTPTLPKSELMVPTPLSPYAASKLAGEGYCSAFTKLFGIETIALRFFNVFGPRQDPNSEYAAVVPRFVTSVLETRHPVIFGDGLQSRDFTFIDNVVDACLLAAAAGSGASGRSFNIGCGGRVSLLALLADIQRIADQHVEPTFMPERPGDVRDSEAAIESARKFLGYHPRTTVTDGLARTVAWFAAQPVHENVT